MNNEFKLLLGVSLEENSASTIEQQIDKLNKNVDRKITIAIDTETIKMFEKTFNSSVSNIKKTIEGLGSELSKSLDSKHTSKSQYLATMNDTLDKISVSFKDLNVVAEKFVNSMSSITGLQSTFSQFEIILREILVQLIKSTEYTKTWSETLTKTFEGLASGELNITKTIEKSTEATEEQKKEVLALGNAYELATKKAEILAETNENVGSDEKGGKKHKNLYPYGKISEKPTSIQTHSFILDGKEMKDMVKIVETYKDSLGTVQTITSVVNKQTGDLKESYEVLNANSEKYANSLTQQESKLMGIAKTLEKTKESMDFLYNNDSFDLNNYDKIEQEYDDLISKYKEFKSVNEGFLLSPSNELTSLKTKAKLLEDIAKSQKLSLEANEKEEVTTKAKLEAIKNFKNSLESINLKAPEFLSNTDNALIEERIQKFGELQAGTVLYRDEQTALRRMFVDYNNEIENTIKYEERLRIKRAEQTKEMNKQKMNLGNIVSKSKNGYSETELDGLQQQIKTLETLNPLSIEYREGLILLKDSMSRFKVETTNTVKELTPLELEIKKLIASFNLKDIDTSGFLKGIEDLNLGVYDEEAKEFLKTSELTNLCYKTQYEVMQKVTTAINAQEKAVKKLSQEELKAQKIKNSQQKAISDKQYSLDTAKSKYSGSYNTTTAREIQDIINSLKDFKGTESEFAKTMGNMQQKLNEFKTEARNTAKELPTILQDFNKIKHDLNMGNIDDSTFLKKATEIGILDESTGKLNNTLSMQVLTTKQLEQVNNQISASKNKINQATEKALKDEESLLNWKTKQLNKLVEIETKNKNNKQFDTKQIDKYRDSINNVTTSSVGYKNEMTKITESIGHFNKMTTMASTKTVALADRFKQMFGLASGFYTMQTMMTQVRTAITSMTKEVMALDTAMIGLNRVTSETSTTYEQMKKQTFDTVDKIGGSAKELVNSTTEFAKLGYSFEEAIKLAESASKYATVGWLSLEEATEALSASYTVFKDEVSGSTEIIDLYNKIGNTMSITSSEIGEALKVSANSLHQANNSIEESVALIATANKTVQNASKVGTALRTISMRIRGVSEDGEELDAKLGDSIASITGKYGKTVEIFDKGTQSFKSTFAIMKELSTVWDDLTDSEQALLSEKIAGKNRVTLPLVHSNMCIVQG